VTRAREQTLKGSDPLRVRVRRVSLFSRRAPSPQVHIGDPRFDDWEVVADYEELETGLAFRDGLRELGLTAELTADHPLDRFSRGDIALRVPADQYGDATVALDGLDPY
jgi:hypothetical protein